MDWSRRKFIGVAGTLLVAGATGVLSCARSNTRKISGSIVGANSQRGHLLRTGQFPPVSIREQKKVVIVGGGVSALSCAWWLKRNGFDDFVILELSDQPGGNAAAGKNEVSEYPWGAHYLPVPDARFTELIEFLEESGVITGFENGLPVYNDYYLCNDPQERLFINGYWQEGLVPAFGISKDDGKEIARFMETMEKLRLEKGSDGKDAFAIPIAESSRDEKYISLDKISMTEYLLQNNFHSEYLHWYVDYGCKDDYGTRMNETSAWAGIHYFAARKGKGANADHSDLLTWPEGNAFLVRKFTGKLSAVQHRLNSLVYKVNQVEDKIEVEYVDAIENKSVQIEAGQVIMCTPQFINDRVLRMDESRSSAGFSYSPWMVANLTVDLFRDEPGIELSWDNVIYKSESLGYVNACNQSTDLHRKQNVLTYYLPLCNEAPAEARKKAMSLSHAEWVEKILADLKTTNTRIENLVHDIDVWIWGHAMIQPRVGFMFHSNREELSKPVNGNIHFAHSDLSGISIFEEAFYQGIRSAKEVLEKITKA